MFFYDYVKAKNKKCRMTCKTHKKKLEIIKWIMHQTNENVEKKIRA